MNQNDDFSAAKLDAVMDFQGRRNDWLADCLGVDPSYITKLRSGAKPITVDLAQRISRILDIPVSFLAVESSEEAIA